MRQIFGPVSIAGLKDLYSSGTTCNIDRVLIQ